MARISTYYMQFNIGDAEARASIREDEDVLARLIGDLRFANRRYLQSNQGGDDLRVVDSYLAAPGTDRDGRPRRDQRPLLIPRVRVNDYVYDSVGVGARTAVADKLSVFYTQSLWGSFLPAFGVIDVLYNQHLDDLL